VGRREELAANLAALEERLASACRAAGRDRREVTLVAVAKTFPADDVRLLASLGIHDIGENRDQEARVKARELADLPLSWHFVGRLQRNKCRSVAGYAEVVHSIDRAELIDAINAGAERAGREVNCLVQVSLDGDAARGGAQPGDIGRLAEKIATAAKLRFAGLMAVAPLGADPAPAFRELQRLADDVRRDFPDATIVSAGMTGDLEPAIAAGSTMVRVGTALFGGRPPMLR
jgi:pyridoxal phosphate enzyme (YggS family)